MSATNKAILIQVKNAGALAANQGKVAALAAGVAPATIESTVLSTVVSKLKDNFKTQGVDADVSMVEPAGYQPASGSGLMVNVACVAGGAAVVGLAWLLFGGRK